MANNKIVFGSEVLIDLTADTVTAEKMLSGVTAHDQSGAIISGTCDYDVNSGDATVKVAEILKGKTAYARGTKLTGTMPNNGAVSKTIKTAAESVTIPQGFHDGSGSVTIDTVEQKKIVAGNIKAGVEILGVLGTLEPSSDVKAQPKTVTPTTKEQSVLPDPEFDYLSQVTVKAIPYVESPNAAGGMTITIAG